MKRITKTTLAGAVMGFVMVFVTLSAQADPEHFFQLGNDSFEQYRPPWRERDAWGRGGGTGVGGHDGENRHYAIDLNRGVGGDDDCGGKLRANASGSAVLYPARVTYGYGNLLGIRHLNGKSSWYAHPQNDTPAPPGNALAQGEYAAIVGKTGCDTGECTWCHLHFQVHNNHNAAHQGGYNTINICMSGDCDETGFDIQHLSDDRWYEHPSNNTGPGYGRPGAPPHLDPGSATQPLSGGYGGIWFAAHYAAMNGVEIGSTLASTQGPCAANRHWVKSCMGGYTQNFLQLTYALFSMPQSLTEGPNGAQLVRSATWKAYGRKCGESGYYTYQQIGRPIGPEWGSTDVKQNFEYGQIVRHESDQANVTVNVYGPYGLLCTFTGLNYYHTGYCYDVTGDSLVRVQDVVTVVNNYGIDEEDARYCERCDVNRDGDVRASDMVLVLGHYGVDCT